MGRALRPDHGDRGDGMIHRFAHLFNLYQGSVVTFQIDLCWFIGFQCSKCRAIDGIHTHPMYNPRIMGEAGASKLPTGKVTA